MRRMMGWIAVVALCCAAAAPEATEDARLQEAQKAYDEAVSLDKAGKYSDAVTRAEHALALREAALGSTHPQVASCLDLLGKVLRVQGKLDRAEPLLQRALAIREAAQGKNHPDVAQSLNNLALVYWSQGLYAKAEPLCQRALTIREAALGKNHPDVAQSLNTLAILAWSQGLYAKAEPLYQRALAIREAALGKNHLEVAASLNNLALVYREQGRYEKAEPLYQRSIAIAEAALGPDHPTVASSLNNLAILSMSQGLYEKAEALYRRALAIRERTLGPDHPLVANSLQTLADLHRKQGLNEKAEPLYQRALAIEEAALGKVHPAIADVANNLALLYADQGQYAKAEPLFQRALAIEETTLGPDHPSVAESLINLANLYRAQDMYEKAEPLCQRARAITEKASGNLGHDMARPLTCLANVYWEQGQYEKAEPLYQRALAIDEAAPDKDQVGIAVSLHNLATFYTERGLYGRAEPLFQRSLAIRESVLGKNHPAVAQSLTNMALLRLAQDRLGAAVPMFKRAFAISERRLRQEALDFSESRLSGFLHYLRKDEERLYALLRANPGNASMRRLALSAALLLKGRSVEEMAGISRMAYQRLGPEDQATFERLRGLRTQLASLSLRGPGALSRSAYQQRLEALTEQGDALEAQLAERSAPLRALAALPSPADIGDRVAAALPKDGALIEFIAYEDRPLGIKTKAAQAKEPRQVRYLALVLFPDATLRVLDLGPAEPIDAAALSLRSALANQDAAFEAKAQDAYRLVFEPLRPLLGKTRRLFLSPDGQLALVPFAALHDGKQFLVDGFDFTYLTSGKDLLPRSGGTAVAAAVVVLADPDFNAAPSAAAAGTAETSVPAWRSASLERFFSELRKEEAQRGWSAVPLPGTRQEAEAIQQLLPQARLFLGAEATKEKLLGLPTPGILHVATHGFFLEDAPTPQGSRAVGHFGALGGDVLSSSVPDPLLRSGLLLAGARAATPAATSASTPPESSVVTALELAGLDLWGTQLVVLSACDTGRGDVKLGQGVYGLRRALVVAGAETVVMSLWKVKDDTTKQLMEGYYRNLLAGKGRARAMSEAMRALRATSPAPHFWAPFIVVGRDTPLAQLP